jgi:hypothetical protein
MHDVSFTNTKRRSQRIEMNVPVVVYKTQREGVLRKYANTCHQCAWRARCLNGYGGTSVRIQVQNHESGEHLA